MIRTEAHRHVEPPALDKLLNNLESIEGYKIISVSVFGTYHLSGSDALDVLITFRFREDPR